MPVFGVGEQEGVHYYAMQFIQGQGLDEVFDELRRLRAAKPQRRSRRGPPVRAGSGAATSATTHGLLTG